MNNRLRKAISFAAVFVLAAFVVSGCGSTGTKDATNTQEDTISQTAKSETTEKTQKSAVNKTGLPIVNEPITFNMMVQKNVSDKTTWAEKEAVKKAEADTGMKFEWTEVLPEAWSEKVSVTIASGNLPDTIIGAMDDTLPVFLESFLPLDDLIEEYGPNIKQLFSEYPEIRVACTQGDGKIYSLPLVDIHGLTAIYALGINKAWLDNLGLNVPETNEELYKVLKAFKEGDPNKNGQKDEIPFGFYLDNSATSRPHFYTMLWNFGLINDGISASQEYVMVENGKIIFIGADQRFYEFLKFMHRLSSEGLIDPDGFLQKYQDYIGKGQKGLYGLICFQSYDDIVVGEKNAKEFIPLLPMKDANGNRTIQSNIKLNGQCMPTIFKIAKNAKYPEALVRLYDYVNSSFENKALWAYGPEGVVVKKNEKGLYERVTKMPEGIKNFAELRQTMSPGMAGFWFLTAKDEENFARTTARDLKYQERIDLYKPYYKKDLIPYGQDTAEATKERAYLFNEINTYMMNFIAESILKGIDDAKWKAHLDNLKKLNVDKFLQSYQAYYDRCIELLKRSR